MNIIKYLGTLEIPETNEDAILDFLKHNEILIRNEIICLWENHKTKSVINSNIVQDKDSTKNTEEVKPILVDNANENRISQNEIELNVEESYTKDNTLNKQTVLLSKNENGGKTPSDSNAIHNKKNITDYELQIKNKNIVIANGKVNHEYRFKFNIDSLGLPDIGSFWFDGLEPLGLTFQPESNEISGIPLIAGDHKITLGLKRNDWEEGKPIFTRIINLIINPDPKSLWKNIPTPTDIEYYKPDSDKCFVKVESTSNFLGMGKTPRKDIVAASQRGRSHAQDGKPRDDEFNVKYLNEQGWYIMTVADGAGYAKVSRKGSEIACTTVVDVCQKLIKEKCKEFEGLIKDFMTDNSDERRKRLGDALYGILGNAVFKAVKNIEEEATRSNIQLKDFSTTLIVSLCKKFKFGWFVGAFWVGDGGIGIYNNEKQFLKILGESDGGEYAGQTRFLTMPEITQPAELYKRLRFDIVDDFTALILMTDGITDPKFETDANLLKIEKWNGLWQDLTNEVDFSDDNESSADQLLSWLDFWSPGNHDDRTIAILF